MAWRRYDVGQGGTAWFFAATLVLGNACSSDSSVNFEPLPNTSGGGASSGGGQVTSGNGTGASQSGGTSSGGTSSGGASSGGASSGGANSGGANSGGAVQGGGGKGGKGTGGSTTAGTGAGGTHAGGAGGNAPVAGASGMAGGGLGGAAGTAGTSGTGGGNGCVPKAEVCDGVDNDCNAVADPQGTCPDGCTGAIFDDRTYYFCGAVESATAAATKCAGFGMLMTSIQSQAENDFVKATQKSSSWLGGSDVLEEDHWLWTDGTSFWQHDEIDGVYENWQEGQPNNNGAQGADENCLVMLSGASTSGLWTDLACGLPEFRATCEPDDP